MIIVVANQGFLRGLLVLFVFILFSVVINIWRFYKRNKHYKNDKAKGHDKVAIGQGKYVRCTKKTM